METVLTTPNDALIGKPTTVNAVPIVETSLTTPTELAAVDVLVICCKHFYIFVAFIIFVLKISNLCLDSIS